MNRRVLRIWSVLLSFVLLISCLSGCIPKEEEQSNASVSQVETVLPESIAPAEPDYITRADWIESLVKAAVGEDGYDPMDAAALGQYFSDMDASHAQYAYVQTAAMMEWLKQDIAKGIFDPQAPATRAFVASTAVTAAGYLLVDGEDEPSEEIQQSADPLALLYAKRLGVISEDESGSLRAEETVDDALCESALTWYASVDDWDEEKRDPVAILNPGVYNLTKDELAYSIDAEGLLHLPANFGEEPATGAVLLLPATAEAPEGIAVKITGGTLAQGFTVEEPILADIFETLDISNSAELELSGEALLTGSSGEAESGTDETGGVGDAEAVADDGDTASGDSEEAPEASLQPQMIERLSSEAGTDEDAEWTSGGKTYRDYFPFEIAEGTGGLFINEISYQYSIRFGKFDIAPTDMLTWNVELPLAVRCNFTFDMMLSYQTDNIVNSILSLVPDFEEETVDAGDGSAQNPVEGLELIEITPGVSVDGSFLGKGAIGIPIGGKGEFAFGDGEMRADTKLDDVDVMYQGELSGNVSLTGGLELKILNCNIIDCSYTMTLAATLEVRDDGDGYCQGIDVVYSDEFKANTFTRVVGLLGTETLILLIDTVLSIVYDDGVGSWARDKLREFRDMLANGMGFGGPRPEAPIARWHWEGKDFASRRRTPNEVCSREFTLELISPTVLDVGESGALSIVAKPHASTAVTGIAGELRVQNLSPDILAYDEASATVTGIADGTATLQLQWWFPADENGPEWESLLKGKVTIQVGEIPNADISFTVTGGATYRGNGPQPGELGPPYMIDVSVFGPADVSGTYHITLILRIYSNPGGVQNNDLPNHGTYVGKREHVMPGGFHVEAGVSYDEMIFQVEHADWIHTDGYLTTPVGEVAYTFVPDAPSSSSQ